MQNTTGNNKINLQSYSLNDIFLVHVLIVPI